MSVDDPIDWERKRRYAERALARADLATWEGKPPIEEAYEEALDLLNYLEAHRVARNHFLGGVAATGPRLPGTLRPDSVRTEGASPLEALARSLAVAIRREIERGR